MSGNLEPKKLWQQIRHETSGYHPRFTVLEAFVEIHDSHSGDGDFYDDMSRTSNDESQND